jgi:hypothetical protein
MTIKTMVVAIASTAAAAAASAGIWYAAAPNTAPAAGGSGSPAIAQPAIPGADQETVIVCAAGDDTLHAPSPQGGCAAGLRAISLVRETDCPLCPPDQEPEDTSDDPAVRDLERRVRALQNAPYFEVVDDDERPIFVVSADGVRIFSKGGIPRAAFGSASGGGYFTASNGFAGASLTATDSTGGVQFVEDGLTRLITSGNDSGGASLRIPSGEGVIAGIGASKDGPGTLLIGTLAGQVRATLSVPADRATVQVSGINGAAISMMQQAIGGGMLQIDSSEGAIVKMGNVDNSYGIVMTGPRPGLPLIPTSGLPGSYLLGCKSTQRPACTPVVP